MEDEIGYTEFVKRFALEESEAMAEDIVANKPKTPDEDTIADLRAKNEELRIRNAELENMLDRMKEGIEIISRWKRKHP